MHLYLNFYDHIIVVSCNEEVLVKKLQDEFNYFVTEKTEETPTTYIEIFKENPPELPSMIAVKILETCSVYKLGQRKYLSYFNGSLAIMDQYEETVRLYSLDLDQLFELAFLAIHSKLGENLPQKGLSRMHALGVSLGDLNALIMLPPRGGKTTLLTHLLDNPEIKILSDDMTILDLKGEVHAFPGSVCMDSKPEDGPLSKLTWTKFHRTQYPPRWFSGLSEFRDRVEAHANKKKNLLISGYRLSQGQSILTPVKKWKMILPLFEHLIFGFDLPQVREMFFSFGFADFIKLPFHFFINCICAVQILRKSECFYFYMGPDISYNAQLILDQLYEKQK